MKTKLTFITVIAMMSFALLAVAADEAKKPADTTAKSKEVMELKPQTQCLVTGKPIDTTAYFDIQGQRIYQCCPMCEAKIMADPDKYFKEAAEQGILFENIQTTDPICGMKLGEKSIFADFEGRRLYFCSDNCKETFSSDPKAVFDKMAAKKEMKKSDESQKDQMKNHEHMKDMEGDSN